MLKEKINKLFKSEGNNKKKIENLVFILVVLVITIVSINFIWNGDENENNDEGINSKQLANNKNDSMLVGNTDNSDDLESKLEKILSNINGVGSVDVLLTYKETTEIVPIYNKKEKVTNTNESDSGGGKRNIEESDVSQEIVYQENNGKQSIAVQKNVSPKIEGAIITATGANDSNVKANIIQAVEAATGIATHKIQVFEKQK